MNILHLGKPIMNASGTLSKESLHGVKDLYGALVTKTVTLEPRIGNPPPRVMEVTGGMINRVGLQNVGLDRFLEEELDVWIGAGLPVVLSIQDATRYRLSEMCKLLSCEIRIAAIELNLSCPNIDERPVSPKTVRQAVKRCRKSLRGKPLIVKLGYERVVSNAYAAKDAGANALTLINTIPALTWTSGAPEPMLGGLSGPAIKPIALRAVFEVSQVVDVPILGCGGIASYEDIEEFFRARASAVQIGSGSFVREPGEIVATEKRTT